jgi:hypothetical protein
MRLGVLKCAAICVTDEKSSEVVTTTLYGYKRPKSIEFRTDLTLEQTVAPIRIDGA